MDIEMTLWAMRQQRCADVRSAMWASAARKQARREAARRAPASGLRASLGALLSPRRSRPIT